MFVDPRCRPYMSSTTTAAPEPRAPLPSDACVLFPRDGGARFGLAMAGSGSSAGLLRSARWAFLAPKFPCSRGERALPKVDRAASWTSLFDAAGSPRLFFCTLESITSDHPGTGSAVMSIFADGTHDLDYGDSNLACYHPWWRKHFPQQASVWGHAKADSSTGKASAMISVAPLPRRESDAAPPDSSSPTWHPPRPKASSLKAEGDRRASVGGTVLPYEGDSSRCDSPIAHGLFGTPQKRVKPEKVGGRRASHQLWCLRHLLIPTAHNLIRRIERHGG